MTTRRFILLGCFAPVAFLACWVCKCGCSARGGEPAHVSPADGAPVEPETLTEKLERLNRKLDCLACPHEESNR